MKSLGGIALIILGWLVIASALASQLYKNLQHSSEVQQVGPDGPFSFRDDFQTTPSSDFWESGEVVSLGLNCLYPGADSVQDGNLRFPVLQTMSLCYGSLKHFRARILCSQKRFPPPFSVTARIQVSGDPGVVSAFYTYTDPLDGNPHYESDLEFTSATQIHRTIITNQYHPGVGDALAGERHFINTDSDLAGSFQEYSIEVHPKNVTFKRNGVTFENRTLQEASPPEKVCLNAWYSRKWPGLYNNVGFNGNAVPMKVDWIEIKSLSRERD